MSLLTIIYLAGIIPGGIAFGYLIYTGDPNPPHWSGQIRGGNKRSAALCGILGGLAWFGFATVFLLILIGMYVEDWVKAGQPSDTEA